MESGEVTKTALKSVADKARVPLSKAAIEVIKSGEVMQIASSLLQRWLKLLFLRRLLLKAKRLCAV